MIDVNVLNVIHAVESRDFDVFKSDTKPYNLNMLFRYFYISMFYY